MAWLAEGGAWRPVATFVSIGCAAMIPLVALLIPEHPGDIGAERFGAMAGGPPPAAMRQARSATLAIDALVRAARVPIVMPCLPCSYRAANERRSIIAAASCAAAIEAMPSAQRRNGWRSWMWCEAASSGRMRRS